MARARLHRILPGAAVLLALTMTAAACQPAADEDAIGEAEGTSTEAEEETAAETGEPAAEEEAEEEGDDVLVVDYNFGHQSADPHKETTGHGKMTLTPVYETLLTFDSADISEPKPLLAESYDVSDDATTFTFHLRDGVQFSDGTPLTAEDVAFSLRRFKNLKGSFSWFLDGIEISAPDDSTVVLESEMPNLAVPAIVTTPFLGVINSEAAIANGATDAEDADATDTAEPYLNENSLGTGPYTFRSYSTTSEIVYERNDNYWGDPAPYQRIVLRNTPPQTQLLNIQSGQADLALDITGDQLESLDPSGLQVVQGTSFIVWYLHLNMSPDVSDLTSNADLRRAVAHAINYDRLLDFVGEGAVRACGYIPIQMPGTLPEEDCVEHSPEMAQEALEASGAENPGFTIEYIAEGFRIDGVEFTPIAEAIQSDLSQVGINAELSGGSLATQIDRFQSGETESHLWSVSLRYPDPASYQAMWPGNYNAMGAGWESDPDVEPLAGQAVAATSVDERIGVYQDIQRVSVGGDGPYIPLYQSAQVLIAREGLTGVETNPVFYIMDLRRLGR